MFVPYLSHLFLFPVLFMLSFELSIFNDPICPVLNHELYTFQCRGVELGVRIFNLPGSTFKSLHYSVLASSPPTSLAYVV